MTAKVQTEAEKKFPARTKREYLVGQYATMGMWFVEITESRQIALATTEHEANEIKRAFEKADKDSPT